MNLWDSLRILRRRWAILVTIAVLTVAGIAFGLRGAAPIYQSRTTLLLVMPAKADGTAPAINPYLNFGSTLIVTGRVLTEAMGQDSTVLTLQHAGAKGAYSITPDPWGQSPTLTVLASDKDPKVVALTLKSVVDATRKELAHRQQVAGAPEASWIAAVEVTAPGKLTVQRGNQIRVVAFGLGVGGILALLLAFGFEGWQRRRVVQWADEARSTPEKAGVAVGA